MQMHAKHSGDTGVLKTTHFLLGARKTHIQSKETIKPKDAVARDSDKPKKHQSQATDHKHKQLDLSTTLVKMWEQFRQHKCSNRAEILQNILTIIKGRVKEVSKSDDYKLLCIVFDMF